MKITLKDGCFVAKDVNEEVWAYVRKPKMRKTSWCMGGLPVKLHKETFNIPDLGPWEDSLHIVKNGELVKYIDRPEIAVDTPVWVRGVDSETWQKRHFSKWGEDGDMVCWDDGRTSFSKRYTVTWSQYSLTDPTKKEDQNV